MQDYSLSTLDFLKYFHDLITLRQQVVFNDKVLLKLNEGMLQCENRDLRAAGSWRL
jgi:hypothetical protein